MGLDEVDASRDGPTMLLRAATRGLRVEWTEMWVGSRGGRDTKREIRMAPAPFLRYEGTRLYQLTREDYTQVSLTLSNVLDQLAHASRFQLKRRVRSLT